MEKDKKMTLGIGSLTNLVKEIREDAPKNPITINENTNCEEWTHFCTTLDKYGKGSAKAVVYIPQELKMSWKFEKYNGGNLIYPQ